MSRRGKTGQGDPHVAQTSRDSRGAASRAATGRTSFSSLPGRGRGRKLKGVHDWAVDRVDVEGTHSKFIAVCLADDLRAGCLQQIDNRRVEGRHKICTAFNSAVFCRTETHP